MNEKAAVGPGMATEARTVLGPVSTICGSDLKIALYIYIQTVCTHTHCTVHTHTHDSGSQVAALQHWSIWKSREYTDTTPALRHCLHSLHLGEQQEEVRPVFTSILMKQRMRNSPSWDWHSFCAAAAAVGAAPCRALLQSGCNWRGVAYELCTDGERLWRGKGGGRRKRVKWVS